MDALPQLPLALGLALVVSSLLGALTLVLRRRRRAAAEPELGPDFGPDFVPESESTAEQECEPEPESEPTPVTERALRAQVRVLEEALASAPDPLAAPDGDLAAYRRQVRYAVQAVAHGADEQTRYALARVAAAIERLDAADGFVRPVLPESRVERVERVERRPGLVAVAPLVEAPAPQDEHEVRVPDALPVAVAVPAPAPEPELVLPVPPPAPAETRRLRRRLRHPAA